MDATIIKQIANVLSLDGAWVLICFGALWAYKILKQKYEQHKIRRTETLGNIKEYFDLPKAERRIFLKELLFEDHFGKLLSWKEISFFLDKSEPIRYLKMYMRCKKYIELCYEEKTLQLKEENIISRKKWFNLILYFATGTPALLMLLGASSAFSTNGPELYAAWVIVTLSLATLAGIFINESMDIDTAKDLAQELNA